jgi:hypothetical protein
MYARWRLLWSSARFRWSLDLFNSDDAAVLDNSCWSLSALSDGSNDQIELVICAGVLPRVVELLGHNSFLVQTPALRCIVNVTGSVQQIQRVLDLGALSLLKRLLSSPKRAIRREACAAISNIVAGGNIDHIQAVIDVGILPTLVEMFYVAPMEIKKEICRVLSNATRGGSPPQIEHLVEPQAIASLVQMLVVPDEMIVRCATDALANMLRANYELTTDVIDDTGGFDHIESQFQWCSEELRCESLAKLNLPRMRRRLAQMCIGLHSLGLSALELLAIFDELEWEYAEYVPLHTKWDMIVAAKHFHKKSMSQ